MTQYNPYSQGDINIAETLRLTRRDCIAAINGQGNSTYRATAQCILTRLTAYEAALISSRQYIITLWPAFVGAICALGPDPGNMVYDNIPFAILFSMTCAGLPGWSSMKPPHHIEAISTDHGRILCENWRPVEHTPGEASRSWVLAGMPERPMLVATEWICFLTGVALYFGFSLWFPYTLRDAYVIASTPQYWLAVAAWYWLSSVPALAAIILSEAWQNRVELYEPQENELSTQSSVSEGKDTGLVFSHSLPTASVTAMAGMPMTSERARVLEVPYYKVNTPTIFHAWSRVIMHQWHRRYYRLLVKPNSHHPYFLFIHLMVGLGRISVFAWGSAWMGDIILMPMPQDVLLLVLLLFTSALPRTVFPRLWSNGARGADLVVYVKLVGMIDG